MGFWGCRSHDNDHVHDELCRAGRRGGKGFNDAGGLTENRLERYLIYRLQPVLMSEKEKEIQIALGILPALGKPICFLGMVIWGLNCGFHFQSVVLDAALAAGYILLRDKEGLQRWKHPDARKKRIAKEIFTITKESPNIYQDRSFVQSIVSKFQWEIDSRY